MYDHLCVSARPQLQRCSSVKRLCESWFARWGKKGKEIFGFMITVHFVNK